MLHNYYIHNYIISALRLKLSSENVINVSFKALMFCVYIPQCIDLSGAKHQAIALTLPPHCIQVECCNSAQKFKQFQL